MRSPTEAYLEVCDKLQGKRVVVKQALSSRAAFTNALEVDETAHGRSEERSFWKMRI
jgi:nucleobase:cation symporter-1, NCS1 family